MIGIPAMAMQTVPASFPMGTSIDMTALLAPIVWLPVILLVACVLGLLMSQLGDRKSREPIAGRLHWHAFAGVPTTHRTS